MDTNWVREENGNGVKEGLFVYITDLYVQFFYFLLSFPCVYQVELFLIITFAVLILGEEHFH